MTDLPRGKEMNIVSQSITFAEILSRAANTLKQEIIEWEYKATAMPNAGFDKVILAPLRAKLAAVETILRIETGKDV